MRHSFIITALLLLVTACRLNAKLTIDIQPEWYRGSNAVDTAGIVIMDSLDNDKIDLLYLVSTEVLDAKNADGTTSYQSLLTSTDRTAIDQELAFIHKNIDCGDFNFLAPYYHQFTFSAITLPEQQLDSVYQNVTKEVCDIFSYYLEHVNNGRRFALVGFSQGAMLVTELLKHSTKQQLSNMVGAYILGYGLSAEDLNYETITPATGAEGFGHAISFNSVLTKEGTWPFVHNNAATVINPVNWQTSTAPANFVFQGDTISVAIDKDINQLMVTVPDKSPYHEYMNANPAFKMANVSPGCLHHWDLLYYTKQIHDNILLRGKR